MASPAHVLGYSRFRYVVPEETKFGKDPRHTPRAVFLGHPMDQRDDLGLDTWPASRIDPGFPTPEQLESFSMPSDHRVGIHDGQARAPAAPGTGQQHPKYSVRGPELRALDASTKDSELLPKGQVLQSQSGTAFEETLKKR